MCRRVQAGQDREHESESDDLPGMPRAHPNDPGNRRFQHVTVLPSRWMQSDCSKRAWPRRLAVKTIPPILPLGTGIPGANPLAAAFDDLPAGGMKFCNVRLQARVDRLIVMNSAAQPKRVRSACPLLLRCSLVTGRVLCVPDRYCRRNRHDQKEKISDHGL